MFLKTQDVMNRYNVSRSTVFRWERSGVFPKAKSICGMKRWDLEDLIAWERESNETVH